MVHRRIKRKAAWWLIALDTAENMEDHWPEFEAWLDENPEHRAAFVSMERAWRAVEELKVFHLKLHPLREEFRFRPEQQPSRFHRSWRSPRCPRALIAAATLIAAAWVLWFFMLRAHSGVW